MRFNVFKIFQTLIPKRETQIFRTIPLSDKVASYAPRSMGTNPLLQASGQICVIVDINFNMAPKNGNR